MSSGMTDIILESISDGVFTVDLDWKITSFNKAAEKITGIKRHQAIGRLCAEVFKSNMCESECPLRKTLKSGRPAINKSGYIINLKGERIPVSISTAMLRDQNGATIGGAETFRDLSEIEELRKELTERNLSAEMKSSSPAMHRIFEIIPALAESSSSVLIQGETGTGKEVLARTIHSAGSRAKHPFVALNCGALPDSLLESELFGYKKGAFTGAEKDRKGRFAAAENGTLFLDEIGEISKALQVKLLRVLQEHEYEPLGSSKTEKTNARIIAATNRNLNEMIKEGTFRKDLFYRINVITVDLPPLRNRKEDLSHLCEYFLEKFNRMQGKHISTISPEVYSLFYNYSWPGNIRELENIIERAFILCTKKTISVECLSPDIFSIVPVISAENDIKSARQNSEKQAIINALEKNSYNRSAAIAELGIDKATFYRKIKSLKIEIPVKR